MAMCTPSLQAQDAFDFVSETMMEAFTLAPIDSEHGLYITASGALNPSDVILGIRDQTGEQATLIIEDSYTALDMMGMDPDIEFFMPDDMEFREHFRQVHGTLIGTANVVEVTALAVPDPYTDDGWLIMPSHHEASFFSPLIQEFEERSIMREFRIGLDLDTTIPSHEEQNPGQITHPRCVGDNGSIYDRIPGQHFGALPRFCVCNPNYNCAEAAVYRHGLEPTCNTTPANPGIVECLKAAQCRLDICLWGIQVAEMMCICEKIKADCERYRRKYGEYPPNPTWKGRADFFFCNAVGSANLALCLGVFGIEAGKCIKN